MVCGIRNGGRSLGLEEPRIIVAVFPNKVYNNVILLTSNYSFKTVAERAIEILEQIISSTNLFYGLKCAIYGLLIVVADWILHLTGYIPILKLKWSTQKGIWLCLGWGIGAGIGGIVGASAGILKVTPQSAVFVGVAWPTVLTRVAKSAETVEIDVQRRTEEL